MWIMIEAVGTKVGFKFLELFKFFLIYEEAVAVW